MNEFFLKNTQAIFEVDQKLAFNLRSISEFKKFELIKEENGININTNNDSVYNNPNKENLDLLNEFKTKYDNYPALFFYGFGNGVFYKLLLENENHKRIIVFEEELEILALAFCMFDFSKDIKDERLIIFHTSSINTATLTTLFTYEYIKNSVKIYNLFIHSKFYERNYFDLIEKINQEIIQIIKFIVLSRGNDPKDSLVGIEHLLINLPKMLEHGIFKKFVKDMRFKAKNAIIVSTGPSLIKQLPILKKYQQKAVIFCADSAYPILAKEGIKPDYVCMLERDEIVAECFNNDFGEFDKDILFICASVVHEKTIEYLEKNKRTYMLVSRPLNFASNLKLNDFGYIGTGASVANMAYELAASLRFENIILIGQDLAYDKDGNSHPKEHIYGKNGENLVGDIWTKSYGGMELVRTQITWNLFRQHFEKDIFLIKEKLNINTYNCTEGGARIEGSIEKSFKEICELLLDKDLNKPLHKIKKLNKEQVKIKIKQTKEFLEKSINGSEKFIEKIQKQLQNFEDKKDFKNIVKNLEKLRISFPKKSFFNEIFQAMYFQNDCEVVKLKALKTSDFEFLKAQIYWYKVLIEYLKTQNKTIKSIINKY